MKGKKDNKNNRGNHTEPEGDYGDIVAGASKYILTRHKEIHRFMLPAVEEIYRVLLPSFETFGETKRDSREEKPVVTIIELSKKNYLETCHQLEKTLTDPRRFEFDKGALIVSFIKATGKVKLNFIIIKTEE